jgi:hypothetical protein
MSKRGIAREKVLATVVSLLDKGLIGVGKASTPGKMVAMASRPCAPGTSTWRALSWAFTSRARAGKLGGCIFGIAASLA